MNFTRITLLLAAGLALGRPAAAEQWFTVANPASSGSGALVEVDLDTVRAREQGAEAQVRITYDLLRAHPGGFGYRSMAASAHFDCQRRTIGYAGASYFAQPGGGGQRLGADAAPRDGHLLALPEAMPAATQQALLKATCGQN